VADSHTIGLLGAVFATAFDALFVVDERGTCVRVNAPATKLLGAPADQVLRRHLRQFTPPEHWPGLRRMWDDGDRAGVMHGPAEVLRPDGSRVSVEFRVARNFDDGRHLIAAREVAMFDGSSVRLTPRELEVLQLAAHGHSTERIGAELVISPATVKKHLEHAYRKLEVRDRVAAVAESLRRGLIQ